MHRMVISTDNVPESDRFSYWREAVFNGLIGYSVERNKDQDHPFTVTSSEPIERRRY